MTSREIVLKAIEFKYPDRVPLVKGSESDIAYVDYGKAHDFVSDNAGKDEWGCVWTSLHPEEGDQGQVTWHPLKDWSNFRHFRFPDPFASGRMDKAREKIDSLHHEGKFVCGNIGKGPMHLLSDLRGFEEYLEALMTEPERIEFLLDGIFTFLAGMVHQFGDLNADAVYLLDDQAMQNGPIFSMDIWRERFKPRYSKLFALAHEKGCKVYMHTCGNLSQHLTELVDTGVDIIDNKQPAIWMYASSVDTVRGNVCFSTCLDIQTVMDSIDIEKIFEEVSLLIQRLSIPQGGFIGTYYPMPDLGIPPEKNKKMIEAFRTFHWT